ATLQLGRAVILESTLSFLGLGIQPPMPSLGSMLADGRRYLDTAWWVATMPGIAIIVLVLCANLLVVSLRVVPCARHASGEHKRCTAPRSPHQLVPLGGEIDRGIASRSL